MSVSESADGDDDDGVLLYSNGAQFERIDGTQTLLLFYTESADETRVLFDADNDAALRAFMERSPYEFDNARDLRAYEALVTRARYRCRAHPQQARALALVPSAERRDDASLLMLVYRRDSEAASVVRNRRRSPFANAENGVGAGAQRSELVLFEEYSFVPKLVVEPVWHQEKRLNATVGLLAVRVRRVIE